MSSVLTTPTARRLRDDLIRAAAAAHGVTDVFRAASERLHALVPHDSAAWVMTDPATGLPSAPSLLDSFAAPMEVCTEHWQREFVDPDVNHFRRLAQAPTPAASLRLTVDDPVQSPRYRWFVGPLGYGDELRAVMRVGEMPWAVVTLWRREPAVPFSGAEAQCVAGLSTPIADALRRIVREDLRDRPRLDGDRPGLLLFDADGRLSSMNEHAAAWLEELPRQELIRTRLGLELPLWLLVTAVRARDSLLAGGDGMARTRVRSRSGRWLVGHATTTQDRDGAPAGTAVVIEPASPQLLAPIVADAYGLTDRELQIARLLARGTATSDIAAQLFLSPHTVRDHVKALLAKAGVSSRGELVAMLYTSDFEPTHLGDIVTQEAR